MTVIHPCYLPAIPLCARVLASDVVVWADTFLFKKQSGINRTQIKAISGEKWLSIPVLQKGLGQQQIRTVKIDNHQPWLIKHQQTLKNNYKNSPYFFHYWDDLSRLMSRMENDLDPLLFCTASFLFDKCGFSKKMVFSSNLPQVKDRSQRVTAWLRATHCDTYLLVPEEKDLIDVKGEYNLSFFRFNPQPYHQQFSGFIYPLSALDLLLNEGVFSKELINKGIDVYSSL